MLIFLERGHGATAVERLRVVAAAEGCVLEPAEGGAPGVWRLRAGDRGAPDPAPFRGLDGVEAVVPIAHPLRHVLRGEGAPTAVVRLGRHVVGDGGLTVIGGPCAVESRELLLDAARAVRGAGGDALRGGAYKPRTSPHEFQGLGPRGIELLAEAREATGLPLVTEAVDRDSLRAVAAVADAVQIGARNMQNFSLLAAAGACGLPVVLKRGLAATVDELLSAAEYVAEAGAREVILCERGIRTFGDHSRFTLDLAVVPVLRRRSRLPVIVDPSHAAGDARSVAPLARAAVAAGADGVMVEVHPKPSLARCDGRQALTPDAFAELAPQLRALHALLGRAAETMP